MFKTGQVANPNGRPKKSAEQRSFELKARFYMADRGIEQIIEMAQGTVKTDRKWALEFLADRGFGRPVQAIDADVNQSGICAGPEQLAGQITALIGPEVGAGAGDGAVRGESASLPGDSVV